MEDKICLDTDFLANFLRNRQEEIEFVKQNEIVKNLATTYINAFELYYGAFKSKESENNIKAVTSLLNRLNMLNLSDESCRKAGEFHAKLEQKGKAISFRDLFIGTIALVNGYVVKTNNVKDFNRIEGLKII